MEALVNFMNTAIGRAVRIVLGLALIYVGLAIVGGAAGWVLAIVGLVPIAMGIWGHCLLELAAPKTRRA